MTGDEYRNIVHKLGLSLGEAGPWLGLSRRTSFSYAQEETDIPEPTARLLRLIKHYKLTPEQASKIWEE